MSNLIRDHFSPLEDEFYPGSTQRRRESREDRRNRLAAERAEAKAAEEWDAHPMKKAYRQDGHYVEVELFPIGALARALQRRPVTIRSWISKGWIPKATFRTGEIKGTRGNAGRRMWNRKQIEGMARIAKEEGLLNLSPPLITSTRFTQRVLAEYRSWTP
jgi:hypothetical protein